MKRDKSQVGFCSSCTQQDIDKDWSNLAIHQHGASQDEDYSIIVEQLLALGSNHPRRRHEYSGGYVSPLPTRRQLMQENSATIRTSYWILCLKVLLRYIKNAALRRTWRIKCLPRHRDTLFFACGDSHAEFLSRVRLVRTTSSLVAYWGGALLANSYARKEHVGYNISRVISGVLLTRRFQKLVLIISVGEIDIRTHSWAQVNLYRNYSNLSEYSKALAAGVIFRTKTLVESLSPMFTDVKAILIEPPPPSWRPYTKPESVMEYKALVENRGFPTIGGDNFRLETRMTYVDFLKLFSKDYAETIKVVSLGNKCFAPARMLSKFASLDGVHISDPSCISDNFSLCVAASIRK